MSRRCLLRRHEARCRSASRTGRGGRTQAEDDLNYYYGERRQARHSLPPDPPLQSLQDRAPLFSTYLADGEAGVARRPGELARRRREFQQVVQERWTRHQLADPSIEHDTALKTLPWSNYLGRGTVPASELLSTKHHRLQAPGFTMPHVWVYYAASHLE